MKYKYKMLVILAPLVFVLDQLSKLAISEWVPFASRIPIIPGYFDIVHFRNTGAAFGLLAGTSDSFRVPFFYVIAIAATVLLILYYRSLKDSLRVMPIAISLVFGGIAGNILDRIRLGSVVDFLSFHVRDEVWNFSVLGKDFNIALEWPAFNVADIAITCAMFILVFTVIHSKEV